MLTKKDRQQLVTDFKDVFATKDDLKKELNPMKKDIRKIKKGIDIIVKFFDQEYLTLKKQVDNLTKPIKKPSVS